MDAEATSAAIEKMDGQMTELVLKDLPTDDSEASGEEEVTPSSGGLPKQVCPLLCTSHCAIDRREDKPLSNRMHRVVPLFEALLECLHALSVDPLLNRTAVCRYQEARMVGKSWEGSVSPGEQPESRAPWHGGISRGRRPARRHLCLPVT